MKASLAALRLGVLAVLSLTLLPTSILADSDQSRQTHKAATNAAGVTSAPIELEIDEGDEVGQKVLVQDVSSKVNRTLPTEIEKADAPDATKKRGPAQAHSADSLDHASSPANADEHKSSAEPAHGHGGPSSVPAEVSLGWLKNGNTRYLKRHLRADGKTASDRTRLLSGQHPHAIVLSCADSRVPPEIVFDQTLGEIFVIRVAGEALDSSVIASVEYAVEHLGPKLIVVMGHTQCGAVQAALTTREGQSAGSPDLDKLVSDIRPRLKVTLKDKPSPNLEVESAVNADGVARDLVKRSAIIRSKVEAGELTIKPALYRMDSGKVSFH